MTTPRIICRHEYPPIPLRSFDWVAYDDRLGADASPCGYGATRDDAIADLLEQLSEAPK